MNNRQELTKQVRRTAAMLVAAGMRHVQVRLGGRLYRLTLEPVFAVGPEEFKAGVRPPGGQSPRPPRNAVRDGARKSATPRTHREALHSG